MDDAEAQSIKRDRERHPDCNYSTAVQETCKNVDGDLTCEVLRRVMRHCPRKRPVEIFSRTTQEQNPDGMRGRMPLMFGSGDEEGMSGFPGEIFKEFGGMDPFGVLEEMFRGLPGEAQPPTQRPPQPSIPPHRRGPKSDFSGTPQGPVERV